jgi:succinoglycan biosynthesis transport protein ExoP
MNFSTFLMVLRARWRVALGLVGLALIASLLVSALMPVRYRATATVVLDSTRPDPIGAVQNPGRRDSAFMATQVEVLGSERVALRVIDDLNLVQRSDWQQRWQQARSTSTESDTPQAMRAWMLSVLQKSLDLKPAREAQVISVSAQSDRAHDAAELANAFVRAYLATGADLRVEPARQLSAFFHQRAKALREQLEHAQAQLSHFQRESGISSSDERLDIESARLAELSSQVTALQAQAADSRSRAGQATASRLPEVAANPALAALQAESHRAEAQLQELRTRLGDNHPQVLQAQAQMQTLRARVESETRRVAASVGVVHGVDQLRLGDAAQRLETQRSKVANIRAAREQAQVMQREVDNARRAYDTVLARWSQAELESQATVGNVHVLSAAAVPMQAASPKPLRNAALATLAGVLLAAATVLALEWQDRRVRSAHELPAALGLPVLAVLPRPGQTGAGHTWGLPGPRLPGLAAPRPNPLHARFTKGEA